MQRLFLFFAFILLTIAINTHSNSSIYHVAFLQDKLFLMDKAERQFAVLSIKNRQLLTNYKLEEPESIIKVNTTDKTVVLRKGRTKVHLFKLELLDIEQINVEIAFSHQQIVDLAQNQHQVYVLTQKDLRVYDRADEDKLELPKHFIASAKRRQFFYKIYIQNPAYLTLVLTRDQQLCIRRLYPNKTTHQNCLFNLSSQIIQIDQLGNNILVQTKNLNYIITGNMTVLSFRPEVTQMNSRYVTIGSMFKTLDLERIIFLPGLAVMGSDAQNQFWLKQQQGKLTLFRNGLAILPVDKSTVIRSWISKHQQGNYYFLVQYGRNSLILYQLQPDSKWASEIKWSYEQKVEQQVEEL